MAVSPSLSARRDWHIYQFIQEGFSHPSQQIPQRTVSKYLFELYQIALANFNNETALKPIGSTAFTATGESAGNIMTGPLERSNVDMTAELLKTVQAQQI